MRTSENPTRTVKPIATAMSEQMMSATTRRVTRMCDQWVVARALGAATRVGRGCSSVWRAAAGGTSASARGSPSVTRGASCVMYGPPEIVECSCSALLGVLCTGQGDRGAPARGGAEDVLEPVGDRADVETAFGELAGAQPEAGERVRARRDGRGQPVGRGPGT